jgi:transketolase
VPAVRTEAEGENRSAKGAYVLVDAEGGKRDLTILATGSEVGIALDAQVLLCREGIKAAVVSMPCWELFERQPVAYRSAVLGNAPRVAVEAGVSFGWERWLGDKGAFVGMTGFGASAPAPKLYEHFGITPASVAEAARNLVKR